MITLFTTGDSACRRVDRVVWPKLLRPVRLRSIVVAQPRRSDESYIRYSMFRYVDRIAAVVAR